MSTTFCYFLLVGVAGFEPTTSCTQNKRTTRLCYTELLVGVPGIEPGMRSRDGVTVHCLTLRRHTLILVAVGRIELPT